MHRNGISLAFASLAVVLAGAPGIARGQVDHLKCYRIKDPLKLKAVVDLYSPQFGLEKGCKVAEAKLFCVPAAKRVIKARVGNKPIDLLPIFEEGSLRDADRICYRVECDDSSIPRQEVTDQFGNRVIKIDKARLLCVPAIKGPPPPKCSSDPTTRMCAGPCPPGFACISDSAGKCGCQPACDRQNDGTCGGYCGNPDDVCAPSSAGAACICQPPATYCSLQTDGTCGGDCPQPGQICVRDELTGGDCTCQPPPNPCGLQSNGKCGGECDNPNEVCRIRSGTADCYCDPPCGDSAPTCNGYCPPNAACMVHVIPNTGTVMCACASPP